MILALDPGTTTGFCIGDEKGNLCISGINSNAVLKPTKKRSATPKHFRLLAMWKHIEECYRGFHFTQIVYEGAAGFMRGKAAIESSHQFRAVILLWAAINGIPVTEVQPQDLQRWATGKGRAEKPEMLRVAKEKYGYSGLDDNEADAILIYNWYLAFYDLKK